MADERADGETKCRRRSTDDWEDIKSDRRRRRKLLIDGWSTPLARGVGGGRPRADGEMGRQ